MFYSLYVINGSLLMNLTGESSVIRAINAQGDVYTLLTEGKPQHRHIAASVC